MTLTEQKEIFAKNLLRLLKDKNITQIELANAVHVPAQSVNTWVKARAIPRMNRIQDIADYLGVTNADLLDPYEPSVVDIKDILDQLNDPTRRMVYDGEALTPEQRAAFSAALSVFKHIVEK